MKERNDCDALAKRAPDGGYAVVLQPLSPPLKTTTVIATTTTFDQRLLLEDILNDLVFMGHLRVTWK